jgi:ribosomal RNA-processing protein 12
MLDLLLLLLPNLPSNTEQSLFEKALASGLMGSPDAGVQKRSYRILARLARKGLLTGHTRESAVEAVVKRLAETKESVAQGAQRVSDPPETLSSSALNHSYQFRIARNF